MFVNLVYRDFKSPQIKYEIRYIFDITLGAYLPQELAITLHRIQIKAASGRSEMVILNLRQGKELNRTHLQPLLQIVKTIWKIRIDLIGKKFVREQEQSGH